MNKRLEGLYLTESVDALSVSKIMETMSIIRQISDGETLDKATKLIQQIEIALQDMYGAPELEQSPYWYAFTGTSPKEGLKEIDDVNQRIIKKKIKEYVSEYFLKMAGRELGSQYTSVLLEDIKGFRDAVASKPKISVYFQNRLQQIVSETQAKFPNYPIRKIPELDHALGGSENKETDIPVGALGDVLSVFVKKYNSVKQEFEELPKSS